MLTAKKPIPLHVLAQLMGHTDTKTTEVYLQVVDEEKRKAGYPLSASYP